MGPHLLLAAVCLGWGTIPAVVAEVGLPGPAIAAARIWVAAAVLGAVVASRHSLAAGPPLLSHRPARTVLCGLLLALHWSAMFAAYRAAPADTVIFVVFLAPVGVAVLAPRVLGEATGARIVVALGLALGGFALVAGPRLDGAPHGVALAVLAAATFVALILLSKPLATAYGGLRLTVQEMAVAGIAFLPLAPFFAWGPPRAAWLWLAVLGVVHTAFGTAVYFTVLSRLPATHVGILGYLEPVGVVLFGWLLLQRPPPPATLAGGALIVAAGALVLGSGRALPAPPPEVPARVPR